MRLSGHFWFFLREDFTSIKSIKSTKTSNKQTKKSYLFACLTFCAFYVHKEYLRKRKSLVWRFFANKKHLRDRKLLFMLFVLINNILDVIYESRLFNVLYFLCSWRTSKWKSFIQCFVLFMLISKSRLFNVLCFLWS